MCTYISDPRQFSNNKIRQSFERSSPSTKRAYYSKTRKLFFRIIQWKQYNIFDLAISIWNILNYLAIMHWIITVKNKFRHCALSIQWSEKIEKRYLPLDKANEKCKKDYWSTAIDVSATCLKNPDRQKTHQKNWKNNLEYTPKNSLHFYRTTIHVNVRLQK